MFIRFGLLFYYTAWVKSHGPSSSRLVFLFKLCSEHVTFVQISILQNTNHIAKQYHNSVLKLARGNKIVTEQKSPLPLLALPFVTIVPWTIVTKWTNFCNNFHGWRSTAHVIWLTRYVCIVTARIIDSSNKYDTSTNTLLMEQNTKKDNNGIPLAHYARMLEMLSYRGFTSSWIILILLQILAKYN